MAIEYAPEPHVVTTSGDFETLNTCLELFRETGHPVAESTIRRWITEFGIPTERRLHRGKIKLFVPFPALLPFHRDMVARQTQAGPRP